MLHGERVVLRPGRPDDAEPLAAMLAEPDVARWWGPQTPDDVREALEDALVIEIGGAPAGWILVDEEDDPDYRSVALDIMVGSAYRGGGYGREALRLAVRHFAARGHHRFTIDPAVGNERAIRAYAAVGFRPVGVMRAYERAPDGTWHDNLLMDLLADELIG
jgi:aminoglycoside 6'-N-acetyltransferase